MIAERISPLIPSKSRRRLSKANKYIFFDISERNASAQLLSQEGFRRDEWIQRFKEWTGLSLIRYLRSRNLQGNLYYWRDHNGPKLDWVVERENRWITLEVKYTENPQPKHIRHLKLFLNENKDRASQGYPVYLGKKPRKITKNITAVP